ncbi:cation:proton antiporter [Actinomyces faecalis]|uniref:cation:proton antiporter n=1 Tax=Actinomyces faecalis TaxID=2722820 RepID=UPI001556F98A|nr:cation:proton antiporter [Actinomyces faecalis]
MGTTFLSLFSIVVVAFIAPLLSWVVPRRIVPETVLLILGGLVIGPSLLGIASQTTSIEFLRELGLAFLFLMAGYEIDVNELRGSGGRHAMVAWLGSLGLAFAAVWLIGVSGGPLSVNGIAIAIAMTSTAIGTILPILRERGLLSTAVGAAILNHGAVGEVGPVILMALLLGSRSTWASLAILLAFVAITLLIVRFTDNVKRAGRRLVEAIHLGGTTTAQTTIRLTVLLLVGLCTLAAIFDLDVVLGAFAAGFILRYAVPGGSRELEDKLDGLAYGFFVPIFFVTSGMAIELELSASALADLAAFLVLLVAVRGVPVWLASRLERRRDGSPAYSMRQSLQVAVYSTTALPIIVAVTQAAVSSGAMTQSFASTLVLAGAASVLIMPAAGLALGSRADHAPAVEALAVAQGPVDAEGRGAQIADSAGVDEAPERLPASEPRRPAGLGPTTTQPESAAQVPEHAGLGGRRLSEEEARHLAARLAQIEADRVHWRTQMRLQRSLDREEAQQRRAVRRALARERRREERDQVRQLRAEAIEIRRQARQQDREQAGAGDRPSWRERLRRRR